MLLTDEEKRAIRAKVKEASGEWHFDLMMFANEIERAVLAKAVEQGPKWYKEIGTLEIETPSRYRKRLDSGSINEFEYEPLYAHPLPAQSQPIGYADQSEIDSIGNRGQSCLILPEPEFDVSVPVFVGSAPAPAQAIPEGYTLAPVEPTPEMLDAGVAMALQVSVHGEGGWSKYLAGLYKQMLSASPKP